MSLRRLTATITIALGIAGILTVSVLAGQQTTKPMPGHDMIPGTNGWNCFPDMPDTKGNDPMCLDEPWVKWLEAYLAKKTPHITRVGIGYMVAPGGAWGSNSDPFAMKEMPGYQWGQHSPHLMILVPDTKALAGISSDPNNGGPYVMWAGTPYVHIMAPTSAPAAMMHK